MDAEHCECRTWAGEAMTAMMLGNGHHPNCQHYKPHVGAVALLAKLVDGIKWWADQEDGVPEELWDAYAEATFVAKGKILDPQPR